MEDTKLRYGFNLSHTLSQQHGIVFPRPEHAGPWLADHIDVMPGDKFRKRTPQQKFHPVSALQQWHSRTPFLQHGK